MPFVMNKPVENIMYETCITDNTKGVVPIVVDVTDHYYELVTTLLDAAKRAANTKGIERHANGEYFFNQQICEIPRLLGPLGHGGPRFQIIKKVSEAGRLPIDRAIAELQDCICYLAADIILLEEEKMETKKEYVSEKE